MTHQIRRDANFGTPLPSTEILAQSRLQVISSAAMRPNKPLLMLSLFLLCLVPGRELFLRLQKSPYAREVIKLGPVQTNGDCTAGPDWFAVEQKSEGLKLAAYKIRLRDDARYIAEYQLEVPPPDGSAPPPAELILDFYQQDYDPPEQECPIRVPATPGIHPFRHEITTGEAPKRAYLRLFTPAPAEFRVTEIRLYRLRSGDTVLKSALGLLLIALFAGGTYKASRISPDLGAALLVTAAVWIVCLPIRPYEAYDTLWNVPVALSLIKEGNTNLNEFMPLIEVYYGWSTVPIGSNRYNFYPIGISLLAIPPVILGKLFLGSDLGTLQLFSARFLFGAIGFLFYFLLRARDIPLRQAVLGTLLFCFATSNLSVLPGALWTHTGIEILLIAALLLLLHGEKRQRPLLIALSALPIGLLYTVRPNSAVFILLLTAYVCWKHLRVAPVYLALLALPLGSFFLWSHRTFGTLLPPYHQMKLQPEPLSFLANLAGLLVSPNRGLLIFVPIYLFALLGAWVVLRRGTWLDRTLTLAAALSLAALACWPYWWGGESYGPRLLADLNPILALLAIEGFRREIRLHRKIAIAFLILSAAFGFFVHLRGAVSPHALQWNKAAPVYIGMPSNVDRRPERLWDWTDLQIFRGL